jgi:hypothetical protein
MALLRIDDRSIYDLVDSAAKHIWGGRLLDRLRLDC